MAPEFESASNAITNAKLAEVDVTAEAALGEEYEIKGFPTLKYFSKGKVIDYDGGRQSKDFVDYIEMMSSDPITKVESVEEAKKIAETKVVFFAKCKADSPEYKVLSDIAVVNRTMAKFIHFESEDNEIVVMNKENESIVKFTESSEELLQKLKIEKLPLFGPVNGENFSSYMDTGLDFVWFAGTEEEYNKVKATIEKNAVTQRGTTNFVWLDSVQFERQIEGMLGITTADLPRLVRTIDGPGKYMLEGEITSDSVTEWLSKIAKGELEPVLKSEEIPESNDGDVKVLVGKNFNDIVTDDKDVVIMIHAPWCGHCKKLMPEFDAAAAEVTKKSPNTVMAILDGTANELENTKYTYSGFPTVYFKPAGSDTPILFPMEERNATEILTYLSTNVKVPFEFDAPKVVEEDDEL